MSWWGDWTKREDRVQADGWRKEDFGGNFVAEDFSVKNLPQIYSIWTRPALCVRHYDDGRITVCEREWKRK